ALADDIFHGVKIQAVLVTRFIEMDDARMIELAERVDLALKADQEAALLGQLRRQDFQRRLPPGQLFLGQVDPAHAPPAQLLENHPLAQALTDHLAIPLPGYAEPRKNANLYP